MHHPPLVGWSTCRPRGCRCRHRGTGPRQCRRQGHRRCTRPPRRCQSGCMRCRHRSTRHSPGGRHITRVCIREGWHTHHCSMRLSPGGRRIARVTKTAHRLGFKTDQLYQVVHPSSWSPSGRGGTPVIVVPIRGAAGSSQGGTGLTTTKLKPDCTRELLEKLHKRIIGKTKYWETI